MNQSSFSFDGLSANEIFKIIYLKINPETKHDVYDAASDEIMRLYRVDDATTLRLVDELKAIADDYDSKIIANIADGQLKQKIDQYLGMFNYDCRIYLSGSHEEMGKAIIISNHGKTLYSIRYCFHSKRNNQYFYLAVGSELTWYNCFQRDYGEIDISKSMKKNADKSEEAKIAHGNYADIIADLLLVIKKILRPGSEEYVKVNMLVMIFDAWRINPKIIDSKTAALYKKLNKAVKNSLANEGVKI